MEHYNNYITTEQDNTRTMEHDNNYITTEQDNTRTMEHYNNYIIIIIFISRKNKQKHCLHRQSDKKTEREATREARRSLNWPPM